ncbi:hypothetical protein NE237_029058 [Protea cynaroides]|uniref:Uncharacterized protein n=1 Tax=Protea cynaroides TaxID=273540 RepID=A0A9Q0GSF5_9MAGN|nr:hypothetical protein NE237_029058 [Protea cynaroides]
MVYYGCVIVFILFRVQCMRTICLFSNPDGSMKLCHISLLFLTLCLSYDTYAMAIAVYIGNSNKGSTKNHSVQGNFAIQIFNAFNAMAIIVFDNSSVLTIVLCLCIRESLALISTMAMTKVIIVVFVIVVGFFKIAVSNWSPFITNGFKVVVTGEMAVFFAYVGLDAVAISIEECRNPYRNPLKDAWALCKYPIFATLNISEPIWQVFDF